MIFLHEIFFHGSVQPSSEIQRPCILTVKCSACLNRGVKCENLIVKYLKQCKFITIIIEWPDLVPMDFCTTIFH